MDIILDAKHFNQQAFKKRHSSETFPGRIPQEGADAEREDPAVSLHIYRHRTRRKDRPLSQKKIQGGRRAAAAALAAILAFAPAGSAFPGGTAVSFAAVSSGVRPTVDEAYYVKTDAYGNPTDASVVKSLQLNGAKEYTDYGTYDSIENLTDNTKPELGNGTATFRFGEDAPSHFYFEGKTGKPFEELPWTISVGYKLNGVRKNAEDLAGEKGEVELIIKAVPNLKASEYAKNNYMLTAVAAFNLNDILSLEAPDAQIQTIGNNRIAAFVWLPGEEQEYSLRIGTDKFEFSGLTFAMGPLNTGRMSEITDLKKDKEEIEDSWDDLNAAVDEILDSVDTMKDSLNTAAEGLSDLDEARSEIHRKKNSFYGDLDSFISALSGLSGTLRPLSGRLTSTNHTVTDLRTNLSETDRILLDLKGHIRDTQSTLKALQSDMIKLQDATDDLDRETHHVTNDIRDLRELSSTGRGSVLTNVNGTISQMTQLYQAYAAYMKSQGLTPVDAIGDGAVLYDLDGAGLGGIGTPSNAGIPVAYDTEGLLDITGVSYPEGSFQDFAISKLEDLGYDDEEIGYAIALWNYRDDVSSAAKGAGAVYNNVDSLAVDILDVDLSALADVTYALGGDAGTGFGQTVIVEDDIVRAIDQLDNAWNKIDAFYPELEAALDDSAKVCDSLTRMTGTLAVFLTTARNIMNENSERLNRGTAKTRSGTSDLLRKSAGTIDSTDKIRKAKQTISDLIDDKWDEYTGEKNNLMKLDTEAQPESLTSPKNRDVTSVSVMIRTAEIEIDEEKVHLKAASTADTRSVGQRIGQMFKDIFSFLTGKKKQGGTS